MNSGIANIWKQRIISWEGQCTFLLLQKMSWGESYHILQYTHTEKMLTRRLWESRQLAAKQQGRRKRRAKASEASSIHGQVKRVWRAHARKIKTNNLPVLYASSCRLAALIN